MTMLSDLVKHKMLWSVLVNAAHPADNEKTGMGVHLDDTFYLFFEDNNDGYRSQMAPILSAKCEGYEFYSPDYLRRNVTCTHITKDEYGDDADILHIHDDLTGQLIITVGTRNIDDYYPWFVCEFYPIADK